MENTKLQEAREGAIKTMLNQKEENAKVIADLEKSVAEEQRKQAQEKER